MTEPELARAYGLDPGSWEAAYEPAYAPDAAVAAVDEPRGSAPPEPPIED